MSNVEVKNVTPEEYHACMAELEAKAKAAEITRAATGLAVAINIHADLTIVFGIRDSDRQFFSEEALSLMEILHDGYQSGTWRPQVGSESEVTVMMLESFIGGRRCKPEDRHELCSRMVTHCLAVMKANRQKSGKHKHFVPTFDVNKKRAKALDQLDQLKQAECAHPPSDISQGVCMRCGKHIDPL